MPCEDAYYGYYDDDYYDDGYYYCYYYCFYFYFYFYFYYYYYCYCPGWIDRSCLWLQLLRGCPAPCMSSFTPRSAPFLADAAVIFSVSLFATKRNLSL